MYEVKIVIPPERSVVRPKIMKRKPQAPVLTPRVHELDFQINKIQDELLYLVFDWNVTIDPFFLKRPESFEFKVYDKNDYLVEEGVAKKVLDSYRNVLILQLGFSGFYDENIFGSLVL